MEYLRLSKREFNKNRADESQREFGEKLKPGRGRANVAVEKTVSGPRSYVEIWDERLSPTRAAL